MYKAVIHQPPRQEDAQKLLQEIARFRADKTVGLLREQGIAAAELQALLCEIRAKQAL